MKISVFGIGYVGAVSAACAARDGHEVIAVDINPDKVAVINAGRTPITEPGLAMITASAVREGRLSATTSVAEAISASEMSLICVGTPAKRNGAIDLTAVGRVVDEIGRELALKSEWHSVVLRSTVLPGTSRSMVIPALERASRKKAGEGFGMAYYPEFLREGSAIRDYDDPGAIVIGVLDEGTAKNVAYLSARTAVAPRLVSIGAAEAAKYFNNAWHALKISFANEVGNIAKSAGLDGRELMDILCSDNRLNMSRSYLRPGFAFGGSCLPKDVRALRYQAKRMDVETPILDAVMAANEAQLAAAFRLIEGAGKRSVGLVGLSFKPGTDDLRDSPMVVLAERLLGRGYSVAIFDENVRLSRLTGANLGYVEEHLPHIGKILSEDLEEVARKSETLVVFHAHSFQRLGAESLEGKAIVDLAGVANREALSQYQGICW